ncbi:hypothetical protein HAX54_028873 [Datura stramonium]|uniref:F-box/LRR-repeat protein 15-like leucin rich repeat domain-containing protein n=1 Tax=Datura stramonium TaxID=4076 RepID=A0ABS8V7M4_DATST|nr:hypothetical protein [Datura stramonium]
MACDDSSAKRRRFRPLYKRQPGDDELRAVLSRLGNDKDKEVFGLVCKRWLSIQSTERKKLCARAGPHMLGRIAARFTRLHELDISQSVSRSFYPGVTDSDLSVIATAFSCLRILNLQNCKGITDKAGLAAIGSSLCSLQSLDVSYCRKITDKGLSAVAEGCRDLRTLHLSGCRFVSDALMSSPRIAIMLKSWVCKDTNITNSGHWKLVGLLLKLAMAPSYPWPTTAKIETLILLTLHWTASFPSAESLRFLTLAAVRRSVTVQRSTVEGVKKLLKSCEYLEYLDVRSCPLITKAGCEEAGIQFLNPAKINFTGKLSRVSDVISNCWCIILGDHTSSWFMNGVPFHCEIGYNLEEFCCSDYVTCNPFNLKKAILSVEMKRRPVIGPVVVDK